MIIETIKGKKQFEEKVLNNLNQYEKFTPKYCMVRLCNRYAYYTINGQFFLCAGCYKKLLTGEIKLKNGINKI